MRRALAPLTAPPAAVSLAPMPPRRPQAQRKPRRNTDSPSRVGTGDGRASGAASADAPPYEARVAAVLAQFRVIFGSARDHSRRIEQQTGISGPALRALATISAQPGIGVTALARALLVRQPTASNIVEELVESGLVRRRRASADQRVVELQPSARAARVLGAAPGPAVGVLPAALSALSPAELAALEAMLAAVINHLGATDRDARWQPIARL